jgi:hypothetical protein
MRRFAVGSLIVVLAACTSTQVKQVATRPAPSLAAKCDSTGALFVIDGIMQPGSCAVANAAPASILSAPCPLYVVDGVIVSAPPCDAPKKSEAPKCDASAPLFVIDGVIVQGAPCGKPESLGYAMTRKSD